MTNTPSYPVLLQKLDFDRQVVSDLQIILPLALEDLLGLLQFGQSGIISGPQVQLFQINSERIVLDPARQRRLHD